MKNANVGSDLKYLGIHKLKNIS